MSRPSPREIFDDPSPHWAFVTQPTDDDFEGQHFDRKEAGRLQADAPRSPYSQTEHFRSGSHRLSKSKVHIDSSRATRTLPLPTIRVETPCSALRHDILHFFARVFAGMAGQAHNFPRRVDPRAAGTMIGTWPQQSARRSVTITACESSFDRHRTSAAPSSMASLPQRLAAG